MANIIDITVIVRKIGSLRDSARELLELQKQQKAAAAETEKLDKGLKDVDISTRRSTRSSFDFNEQLSLLEKAGSRYGDELEKDIEMQKLFGNSMQRLRGELHQTGDEFDDLGHKQQSFFDKVSKSGLVRGERGQIVLSPVEGQDVGQERTPVHRNVQTDDDAEAMRRLGNEIVRLRNEAKGGSDDLDVFDRAVSNVGLSSKDSGREIDRLAEGMGLLGDEARQAGGDIQLSFRDLNHTTEALADLDRAVAKFRGDKFSTRREQLFGDLESQFRKDADAVRDFDVAAASSLDDVANRIRTLRDSKGPIDTDTLDKIAQRFPQIKNEVAELQQAEQDLSGAEDTLRHRADLTNKVFASRNNLFQNLIARGRLASFDFFSADRASGAERDLKRLKVSEEELAKATGDLETSFRDLNPVDDTVAIGFRRIARFLAVVVAAMPLVVVAAGTLVAALTTLVGGAVELVGALSTLSGLLATLPALFAGLAGGILAITTIFGPSIKTVLNRVAEVVRAQNTARRNSKQTAEEVARAERSLADQRRTGAEQVFNLEKQISEVRVTNIDQVKDAEQDLHFLRIHNRERERDLEKDIDDARIRAADRLKTAEERLAQIRKQNALRQRELEQDVNNARAELAGLIAEGASPQSVAAARARVNEAEGTLAQFGVGDEKKREKDAERDIAKIKRDNAKEIARLQEQLRRAKRDDHQAEERAEVRLQRLRRDNLNQILRLERSLKEARINNAHQILDAEATLAQARRRAEGDTISPLKGLDPIQRKIVLAIIRIKDEWKKLTATTRLGGEAFGLKVLLLVEKHLPEIAKVIDAFAQVLLKLAEAAFNRFSSPKKVQQLLSVFEDGLDILSKFGGFLIDIADAMITIGERARPLTKALGNFIQTVGRSVRGRATRAARRPPVAPSPEDVRGGGTGAGQQPGEADQFFAATERVARLLGRALGNLARAFKNILTIAEPFGEKLLKDFVKWTKTIADFTDSPKGQKAILEFFKDVTPVFEELIGLGADFVKTIFQIGRDLVRGAGSGKKTFFLELLEDLRKGLPGFRDFVSETTEKNGPKIIDFLRSFIQIVGVLVGPGGPFTTILGALGKIGHIFAFLPAPLTKLLLTYITLGFLAKRVVVLIKTIPDLLEVALAKFTAFGRLAGKGGGLAALANSTPVLKAFFLILLTFPGLMTPVIGAFKLLFKAIEPVLRVIRGFFHLLGVSDDTLTTTAFSLILFRKHFKELFGSVKAFIALTRSGGILGALGAQFPVLTSGLSRLRVRMAQLTTSASIGFTNLGNRVRRFGTVLRDSVGAPALARLRAIGNGFVNMSKAAVRSIGQAIAALFRFLAAQIAAFVTSPIGLIIIGIAALVAGIILLDRKFHFIKPTIEAVGRAFKFVADFITKHWKDLIVFLLTGGLGLAIKQIIQHFDSIKKAAKAAVDAVLGFFRGLAAKIVNAAGNFGRMLLEWIKTGVLFAITHHPLVLLVRLFIDKFSDIKSFVVNTIKSIGTFIVNFFTQTLPGFAKRIAGAVRGFAGDIASVLVTPFQTAFKAIKGFLNGIIGGVNWVLRHIGLGGHQLPKVGEKDPKPPAGAQGPVGRYQGGFVEPTPGGVYRVAEGMYPELVVTLDPRYKRRTEFLLKQASAQLGITTQPVVEERRTTMRASVSQQRVREVMGSIGMQEAPRFGLGGFVKGVAGSVIHLPGKALGGAKDFIFDKALLPLKKLLDAVLPDTPQLVGVFGKIIQSVGDGVADGAKRWVLHLPMNVAKVAAKAAKLLPAAVKFAVQQFAEGGVVHGALRGAVPIMAHAGEWVLNERQQVTVARLANTTPEMLREALFTRRELMPKRAFADGGIVSTTEVENTDGRRTTVNQTVNVNTASEKADVDYIARILEQRMAAL